MHNGAVEPESLTRRELSNDEFCPRRQSQYETLRRPSARSEVLARLPLSVRRRGWHLTVRGAQAELRALLALAGLIEVLGVTSNSPSGPAPAG